MRPLFHLPGGCSESFIREVCNSPTHRLLGKMHFVRNLWIFEAQSHKRRHVDQDPAQTGVASRCFYLSSSWVESELQVTLMIAYPILAIQLLMPWQVIIFSVNVPGLCVWQVCNFWESPDALLWGLGCLLLPAVTCTTSELTCPQQALPVFASYIRPPSHQAQIFPGQPFL